MRLGELKNILDDAVNENNALVISSEPLYEGKRFIIRDYKDLITALENIADLSWVKVDTEIVTELLESHGKNIDEVEISPDENNRLNALVNNINKGLPIFYSILEEASPEQDEQVVNVKIPADYTTDLDKLNEFNKELQEVFKLVVLHKGLRGDAVQFQGFDIGTSWYQMLIMGAPVVYYGFMGLVEMAEKLIHLRISWYKSEETRLNYEIKKRELEEKKKEQYTLEKHVNALFELKSKEDIDAFIEKLGDNAPNNTKEMHSSLSKGLKKIIELMEKSTEFHPSLNTPEFIDTDGNIARFHVEYDALKKHLEKQKKEDAPKQIAKKNDNDSDEDDEGDQDE